MCVCVYSQRIESVILCDQVCRAERKVVIEPWEMTHNLEHRLLRPRLLLYVSFLSAAVCVCEDTCMAV